MFYPFAQKITAKIKTPVLPWKADIADKEKLTIDDAKFIFDQAEKLLNDSVATSETIVSRMNTLITLITGSLLALLGYLISKLGNTPMLDKGFFTASFGAVYLYVLAIVSFVNNYPKTYLLPGALPKDLFDPSFFDSHIPKEGRILRYYVNEIENYQGKIEANSELNETRWTRYKTISKCLLSLPLLLMGCYIILTFC